MVLPCVNGKVRRELLWMPWIMRLNWYDSCNCWPLVIAGIGLGLLTFSCIGVLLGAILPSARAVQGAGLTLFFVMMMISGSGPPLEGLPSAMRAVSNAMPLTHLNLVVQDAWLGFGWSWAESLITLAFGAASGTLAVRFFRWE